MTAKNMPYKHGFGPFAPRGLPRSAVLSVPRRRPRRAERAARPRDRPDREAGRRREPRGASSSSRSRARAGSSCPRLASCPRWPSGAATTASSSSPTRCRPASPAPGDCSPASTRASCPTSSSPPRASPAACRSRPSPAAPRSWTPSHVGGLGGTYGGNPLACAAALAAIETIEADGLRRARPRDRASSCSSGCTRCSRATPRIGDIRGRGAMIAVELVRPGTTTPDAGARQGGRRPRARSRA